MAAVTLAAAASATPEPIRHVADLPAEVRAALKFEMVDPGEPYQATDVVIGKPLPFERLVRAKRNGTTWTIEYERGGIAYSLHRTTVRLVDGKYVATDEWLHKR